MDKRGGDALPAICISALALQVANPRIRIFVFFPPGNHNIEDKPARPSYFIL